MDHRRTAIYCRISLDKEGAGIKVEDQRRDCLALADRLGLTVDPRDHKDGGDVFTDNDISAYTGKKRPGYEALIKGIKAGQVGTVLALHIDRINRNFDVAYEYISLSEKHDAITHTIRAGRWDLSNATNRATALTQAIWAHHENALKIERQKAANRHRAMRGQWNGRLRPFGYEPNPDQGPALVVVEREAAAIRWAADQVVAGASLRSVARRWNEDGILTTRGNTWSAEVVGRALQRPTLAGRIVYDGKVLDGIESVDWPAILDPDTFEAVCAILQDPGRSTVKDRTRRYLLGNLARCGVEGCDLTVRTNTDPGKAAGGKDLRIYMCRSGGHVRRNAEAVEEYVEAVIVERLSRPDAIDLMTPDPDQKESTAELHRQYAALRVRKDQLAVDFAEDEIDASQLRAGTRRIEQRQAEITAQLQATNHGSVLAGLVDADDVEAAWKDLDLSRKRAVIETLIEIVILPAKRGQRRGRRPGEPQFAEEYVEIRWKTE